MSRRKRLGPETLCEGGVCKALMHLVLLFLAKVLDNIFATSKTILVSKNKSFLAGIALGISNFIYLSITKNIVQTDSFVALVIVSIASGVGCCIAVTISNKFSKEKTYVNVIMSDDNDAIAGLHNFLVERNITHYVGDSYTRDLTRKTLTITAFAETKNDSRSIDRYLDSSGDKFKRMVDGRRKRHG